MVKRRLFNISQVNGCFWREIIVYSQSTINTYYFLSHEGWVLLIKFMVRPTIHVRGGLRIYGTLEVPNNFLI